MLTFTCKECSNVMIASLIQECLLLLLNSWHKKIPKLDKEIHLASDDGSRLATFNIIVITVSYKTIKQHIKQ